MPFRDITGHRRLLDLLARSIERRTLPPSLIFEGPAGAGKRATAVAVAQALNCMQSGPDACGECAACKKIVRGVHPDVMLVEAGDAGTIKIDQVRDVIDRANYRPFEGRRRVFIIDAADNLATYAQNGLLKIFEEPPSMSVFILTTSRPDTLLPTLRSRCIRLRFAAGATETIDQEARDDAERVLSETARSGDAGRRLDTAKELQPPGNMIPAEQRQYLASRLRAMSSLLRDVEVLATRADERVLANTEVRPALERLAPAYGGERGVRAFTAIDEALMALDRNVGVKVVADWVVLQL
jgi:DNA polymerase-3 subunit delta'